MRIRLPSPLRGCFYNGSFAFQLCQASLCAPVEYHKSTLPAPKARLPCWKAKLLIVGTSPESWRHRFFCSLAVSNYAFYSSRVPQKYALLSISVSLAGSTNRNAARPSARTPCIKGSFSLPANKTPAVSSLPWGYFYIVETSPESWRQALLFAGGVENTYHCLWAGRRGERRVYQYSP